MARPKLSLFAWSAGTVARELGIKRDTFVRAAANASLSPDKEGKWTSKQVFLAITGNSEKTLTEERMRLYREQTRRLELANAKTQAEQVSVDEVYSMHEGIFIALRQTVLASHLTEEEKAECLAQLRHDILNAPSVRETSE